jgi:hypothetical protein
MAVKTCAPTVLVSGTAATLPETTAINGSTDTINITGGSDADKLLLVLNNTTAATKEFTIKAGENPPAVRKGLGDLVVTMLEKTQQVVAVESARFANADGTISLSFQGGSTGFVSAIRIPRGL